MATIVIMPKQGNTVETCVINSWAKKEGDTIAIGDTICEIETDKATMEVESTAGGVVLKCLYEEGDDVPVQKPIAIIGKVDEDISTLLAELEQEDTAQSTEYHEDIAPQKNPNSTSVTQSQPSHANTPQEISAKKISPRAKKLAQHEGIDYSNIKGSGPRERIVVKDIENVLTQRETKQSKDISTPIHTPSDKTSPLIPSCLENKTIPLQGVKKVSAERMTQSLATTAQLTLHRMADVEKLLEIYKYYKAHSHEDSTKITIGNLLIYVVSRSFSDFPLVNSHFSNNTITQFTDVHIGCAVDTPNGLFVPTIKNADKLSLIEQTETLSTLANKCQTGVIEIDDLTGGTFTISNLGAMGIEYFTPILNPPQTTLLGIGTMRPTVIYNDKQENEFKPHVFLSLTFDHQAYDGMYGAKFLKSVADNIANIDSLFFNDILKL